jgi:hypothetical protein
MAPCLMPAYSFQAGYKRRQHALELQLRSREWWNWEDGDSIVYIDSKTSRQALQRPFGRFIVYICYT